MLKKLYIITFVSLIFTACNRELPTYMKYDSYDYASNDDEGGNWKPILLSSNEQIKIDQPAEVSSGTYKTELSNLKSVINKASNDEQDAVYYWTNNPINRWNEIALSLIGKYNLLPRPDANGIYHMPDPNNPAVYPYFPFAHPPYAARALAYLSVAQYDGIITAWHYKYKFNRQAPYTQDASIKYAYPQNSIPSYPSDGAVIAEVSRQVLSEMFPNEKTYLQQKADELIKTLMVSGGNTQSDIDAGKSIGSQIAAIVMARAKTDGMVKAQTPQSVSDSMSNAAYNRFGWRWINMEMPQRPVGITPFMCFVKLWNVPNVEAVRPPTPPSPDSKEFETAAEELRNYEKIQTPEHIRIANYWAYGTDTYAPPGRWDRFAKEYIVKYKLNPIRAARVYAYLNMVEMDAAICCWDAKYYYNYPRPIQLLKGLRTVEPTPNFPGYPSGHSTFSGAAAGILSYFFPQEAAALNKFANEAGMSRLYGLIHFSFDNTAGLEQGAKVAQYSINKAKLDGAN